MRPLPSTTRGGYERNRPTNWGISQTTTFTTYLYGLEEGVERTERTKKTTQQRGVYATNHATWSKKAGEFPEIPKRNSSTQALVLVGNKWTADALSEIGVSTQGGNSIEREAPNSWMFFFMVKAKITWMISGYTKMTWETSVYMMITMIYDDYN